MNRVRLALLPTWKDAMNRVPTFTRKDAEPISSRIAQVTRRLARYLHGGDVFGRGCQPEDGHVPVQGFVPPRLNQKGLVEDANTAIRTDGFIKLPPRFKVRIVFIPGKFLQVFKVPFNFGQFQRIFTTPVRSPAFLHTTPVKPGNDVCRSAASAKGKAVWER